MPWWYIGQVLPVRVTEGEVIIYGPPARRSPAIRCCRDDDRPAERAAEHHPADDPQPAAGAAAQRFAELGPVAVQFLDGLLQAAAQGKDQAHHVLALLAHYPRDDVLAALERAVRFGASPWRRCAASWRPGPAQSVLDELAEQEGRPAAVLAQRSRSSRPSHVDYQPLLTRPEPDAAMAKTTDAVPADEPLDLRDQILADFATLEAPVDRRAARRRAGRGRACGLSHLEFLHRLLAEQAVAAPRAPHRPPHPGGPLPRSQPLATFDWNFNPAIDRVQIEALAQGDFIRRRRTWSSSAKSAWEKATRSKASV